MKTPYESKPWPVRVLLWLRWRPWYFLCFCSWMLSWALQGAKRPDMKYESIDRFVFPTRGSFVEHLWTMSRSMADFKMGNCLTLEEWAARRSGESA